MPDNYAKAEICARNWLIISLWPVNHMGRGALPMYRYNVIMNDVNVSPGIAFRDTSSLSTMKCNKHHLRRAITWVMGCCLFLFVVSMFEVVSGKGKSWNSDFRGGIGGAQHGRLYRIRLSMENTTSWRSITSSVPLPFCIAEFCKIAFGSLDNLDTAHALVRYYVRIPR